VRGEDGGRTPPPTPEPAADAADGDAAVGDGMAAVDSRRDTEAGGDRACAPAASEAPLPPLLVRRCCGAPAAGAAAGASLDGAPPAACCACACWCARISAAPLMRAAMRSCSSEPGRLPRLAPPPAPGKGRVGTLPLRMPLVRGVWGPVAPAPLPLLVAPLPLLVALEPAAWLLALRTEPVAEPAADRGERPPPAPAAGAAADPEAGLCGAELPGAPTAPLTLLPALAGSPLPPAPAAPPEDAEGPPDDVEGPPEDVEGPPGVLSEAPECPRCGRREGSWRLEMRSSTGATAAA